MIPQNVQKCVRAGGKGAPRRAPKKSKNEPVGDDKKLHGVMKKLRSQVIPNVEEVNFFGEDEQVLHFTAPQGTNILISYRVDSVKHVCNIRFLGRTKYPGYDSRSNSTAWTRRSKSFKEGN